MTQLSIDEKTIVIAMLLWFVMPIGIIIFSMFGMARFDGAVLVFFFYWCIFAFMTCLEYVWIGDSQLEWIWKWFVEIL